MFYVSIWSYLPGLLLCPYSVIIRPELTKNWFTDLYNSYGILDQKIKYNFRECINYEWQTGFILDANSDWYAEIL